MMTLMTFYNDQKIHAVRFKISSCFIITLPQVQHFRIMSFSSRRRNYLLTPHRRDGLIEWYEKRRPSFHDVTV
jgi:hypothetical protein